MEPNHHDLLAKNNAAASKALDLEAAGQYGVLDSETFKDVFPTIWKMVEVLERPTKSPMQVRYKARLVMHCCTFPLSTFQTCSVHELLPERVYSIFTRAGMTLVSTWDSAVPNRLMNDT